MSFWKKAGWIAAGVTAVVAAPVTGGGSIAALVGAAGTTTAAGVAIGAAAGLAASELTDDSVDRARSEGRNEGRAENAIKVKKIENILSKTLEKFDKNQDREDYLMAIITVGMACAACDGEIDPDEEKDIKEFVLGACQLGLSESIKNRIKEVTESSPSLNTAFEIAKPFMDTEEAKQNFLDVIELAMHADNFVSEREKRFLESWKNKVAA